MFILADRSKLAVAITIPILLLCSLIYWGKYAIRVIGYFRKQNQNAWPKWLGLWTTANILWVIASFQWEFFVPTALVIFFGPIVGSFTVVTNISISLHKYGLEAYPDLLGRDDIPYLLLALVFSTTAAGLVIALNTGRLRQGAACAILVAISVGAALVLNPQPPFNMP